MILILSTNNNEENGKIEAKLIEIFKKNYVSTSFLVVCFIIQFIYHVKETIENKNNSDDKEKEELWRELTFGYFKAVKKYTGMSWKKLLPLSLLFSTLWIGANYLFVCIFCYF